MSSEQRTADGNKSAGAGQKICHKCGSLDHTAESCTPANIRCGKCGEYGHYTKDCVAGAVASLDPVRLRGYKPDAFAGNSREDIKKSRQKDDFKRKRSDDEDENDDDHSLHKRRFDGNRTERSYSKKSGFGSNYHSHPYNDAPRKFQRGTLGGRGATERDYNNQVELKKPSFNPFLSGREKGADSFHTCENWRKPSVEEDDEDEEDEFGRTAVSKHTEKRDSTPDDIDWNDRIERLLTDQECQRYTKNRLRARFGDLSPTPSPPDSPLRGRQPLDKDDNSPKLPSQNFSSLITNLRHKSSSAPSSKLVTSGPKVSTLPRSRMRNWEAELSEDDEDHSHTEGVALPRSYASKIKSITPPEKNVKSDKGVIASAPSTSARVKPSQSHNELSEEDSAQSAWEARLREAEVEEENRRKEESVED